jgi:hemin uptake protein HemP
MHDDPRPTSAAPAGPAAIESRKPSARRISSVDLFSGAREIIIEHDGRFYQLRITQNGKLILTA